MLTVPNIKLTAFCIQVTKGLARKYGFTWFCMRKLQFKCSAAFYTSYLTITPKGNSTVSIYMHMLHSPGKRSWCCRSIQSPCVNDLIPWGGGGQRGREGGNNRKGEMEVRWGDRGGFQIQQWFMGIFLPQTVNAHLGYIKARQMRSPWQGGEIKHGSLCLRVRWQALNGVTGWSRPLSRPAGSSVFVGDRSQSGWHRQLVTHGGAPPGLARASQSDAPSIKTDQTRCYQRRPCECEAWLEGVTAKATVQQCQTHIYWN